MFSLDQFSLVATFYQVFKDIIYQFSQFPTIFVCPLIRIRLINGLDIVRDKLNKHCLC